MLELINPSTLLASDPISWITGVAINIDRDDLALPL
jgi:hypothetical protein